jgi:hypothetical protein
VNIRLLIHTIAVPSGTPSDHIDSFGNGLAYEPPVGVAGLLLLRVKTNDVNAACADLTPSPFSPSLPYFDHNAGALNEPHFYDE